jgi:hypothetical protein
MFVIFPDTVEERQAVKLLPKISMPFILEELVVLPLQR